MNSRIVTVLVGALLISACASYLVYRLAGGQNVAVHEPGSEVVVAARELLVGTIIHESDLKMAGWVGAIPKGSSAKKAIALNRGVVSTIYENEPVMENRLALAGSGGGLASTIPAGMRACAVRVNEVMGVAGFVVPGMRVDVLITGNPPGAGADTGPAVKTLLQNIQVLSAGVNIDKDREGKPQQVQVVNLLVTPEQAEILSLAGNEMRIQLILRNPLDTQLTAPPGTVMSELFGHQKVRTSVKAIERVGPGPRMVLIPPPRIDPPAAAGIESVEVLNGGVRTQVRFQAPVQIHGEAQ